MSIMISIRWCLLLVATSTSNCQAFLSSIRPSLLHKHQHFVPVEHSIGISNIGTTSTSTIHPSKNNIRVTSLHLSSNSNHNNNNNNHPDDVDPFTSRTDPRHLLTQRSLQSFLLLLQECHDPHTVSWMESYLSTPKLLEYHGTGALDLSKFPYWDSVFVELVRKEREVCVVEVKRRGEGRGLSENNPYREVEDYSIQIEIEIDPISLVHRILSVRTKLAQEWVQDLQLVQTANAQIMESYQQKILKKRMEEVRKKDWIVGCLEELCDVDMEMEEDGYAGCDGYVGYNEEESEDDEDDDEEEEVFQDGDPFNPLLQAMLPNRPGDNTSGELTAATYAGVSSDNQSFDRMEIYLLNNHPSFQDMESSPLRASNFDLLFLLSTQESLHRLLKQLHWEAQQQSGMGMDMDQSGGSSTSSSSSSGKNESSNSDGGITLEWLTDYYQNHLEQYFDGDGPYGRSDDFLDSLLQQSPTVHTTQDGKVGYIDPLAIVEDIVTIRTQVLKEWQDIMSLVSMEQGDLQQMIHVKQMEKWGQRMEKRTVDEGTVGNLVEESFVEGIGEFE